MYISSDLARDVFVPDDSKLSHDGVVRNVFALIEGKRIPAVDLRPNKLVRCRYRSVLQSLRVQETVKIRPEYSEIITKS
jgi:hypothetical protein